MWPYFGWVCDSLYFSAIDGCEDDVTAAYNNCNSIWDYDIQYNSTQLSACLSSCDFLTIRRTGSLGYLNVPFGILGDLPGPHLMRGCSAGPPGSPNISVMRIAGELL